MVQPAPRAGLRGHLLEHPFPQLDDQAGGLGHGDELGGANQPTHGMPPAQQCLGLADAAIAQVHDGLVFHMKLPRTQARAQVVAHAHAVQRGALQRRGVEAETVAPGALGHVQRLVRVLEQAVNIARVAGAHRDADAGGHEDLLFADAKSGGHGA